MDDSCSPEAEGGVQKGHQLTMSAFTKGRNSGQKQRHSSHAWQFAWILLFKITSTMMVCQGLILQGIPGA